MHTRHCANFVIFPTLRWFILKAMTYYMVSIVYTYIVNKHTFQLRSQVECMVQWIERL